MAKYLLLRSSTVVTALLAAKSAVICFGSNEASIVTSSHLSSISLPKISVVTANNDSDRRSNNSSWWNVFDGIPFLVDRRPIRKLSKVKVSNSGGSNNDRILNSLEEDTFAVDDFHRFLAFGDYADTSFQCPVTTTCPIVCVADVAECPDDALCPDDANEYELCADGSVTVE